MMMLGLYFYEMFMFASLVFVSVAYFCQAIENVKPSVGVARFKKGGAMYQVHAFEFTLIIAYLFL